MVTRVNLLLGCVARRRLVREAEDTRLVGYWLTLVVLGLFCAAHARAGELPCSMQVQIAVMTNDPTFVRAECIGEWIGDHAIESKPARMRALSIAAGTSVADVPVPIPAECFHYLVLGYSERSLCSIPPWLISPADRALAAHYGSFAGYALLLHRGDVMTAWTSARASDPEWRESWGDIAVYLGEHLLPSPACDCAVDRGNAVYPQRSPFGLLCWRRRP